jgi:two-component system nitrogen regulation sensor histidine kinase NtrY
VSIRARLLAACAIAGTLPVVLLAALFVRDSRARLEEAMEHHLEGAVGALRAKLERESKRAGQLLSDLPASLESSEPAPDAFPGLGALDLFEIVDDEGKRLASLHWAAGVGLPDDDVVVSRVPPLRIETVADGFGSARRLSVVAERPVQVAGRAATARGGFIVGDAFLRDAADLLGVEVAIRLEPSKGWIVTPGLTLPDAGLPLDASRRGRFRAGHESWQYASRPLGTGVWVVTAATRTPLEAELRRLGRMAFGAGAVALLLALLGAAVATAQLVRPLRALTEGVTGVARGDLTHQVAQQRSDELGELARTFNDMTAALRASETRLRQAERVAAWREMARRLAHELKNPLFPIQISIESLARAFDRAAGDTPPELRALVHDSAGTLLRELRGLRATVDAFASFARTPPPAPRPTDLGDLVEHVLAVQRPAAARLRLDADFAAGLPPVRVDPAQISRAVTNLVTNAIAVSPDGARISVRLRPEGGGAVALEVADEGPGLDPEEQARVFTPYHTTRSGGTGLGLAIVQAIASDHGGRVEVESQKGRGATFRLVLPVAGPAG